MKKRLFASIAIVMTMVIGVTAFAQSGLTQEQFLTSYLTMLLQQSTPPQSAKYIQVRYHDVPSLTLYHLLQQAIVLDMFPNANVQIDWNAPISQQEVA